MIIIIHQNAQKVVRVIKGDAAIKFSETQCVKSFWKLAEQFPEEIILWCEEKYLVYLNIDQVSQIFHHDLIMASYPIESKFFPESLGYVDQFPFVNPDYFVSYPSWRMSSDVGGIKAKTALKFRSKLEKIESFGYLINSIARLGQQNSLFCYSDPNLVKGDFQSNFKSRASTFQLFNFVAQHYKREWLFVLLFCLIRYEGQFPLRSFLRSLFVKSDFNIKVDLTGVQQAVEYKKEFTDRIDVIIPTIGRPDYLKQVLLDLKVQTFLPQRVIIVEQNQQTDSRTQLNFIQELEWPFEIVHHFIHRTGACHARNLAMKSVKGDWIFYADDDIRINKNLIENALKELHRLKVSALNLNCIQPNENTYFEKIKQWAAFGSGTSVVRSSFALQCQFSEALEFGFGEDIDFGLQLRSKGCDIIYHPDVKITHLKANSGGFRYTLKENWNDSELEPKPAPTMMWLAKKYYTAEMMKGYQVGLFLKFYKRQKIRNPWKYIRLMKIRWSLSEKLSEKLPQSKGETTKAI